MAFFLGKYTTTVLRIRPELRNKAISHVTSVEKGKKNHMFAVLNFTPKVNFSNV